MRKTSLNIAIAFIAFVAILLLLKLTVGEEWTDFLFQKALVWGGGALIVYLALDAFTEIFHKPERRK